MKLVNKKLTEEKATALMHRLDMDENKDTRHHMILENMHLRPDLMLIKPSRGKTSEHNTHSEEQAQQSFTIVELGYCREGRGKEKMIEKSSQDRLLEHLLKNTYDQSVTNIQILTVTLGVTGAIYRDVIHTLQALDLHSNTRLLNKLIDHALNSTHAMVVKRRQLQAAAEAATNKQPHRGKKRKRPPDG